MHSPLQRAARSRPKAGWGCSGRWASASAHSTWGHVQGAQVGWRGTGVVRGRAAAMGDASSEGSQNRPRGREEEGTGAPARDSGAVRVGEGVGAGPVTGVGESGSHHGARGQLGQLLLGCVEQGRSYCVSSLELALTTARVNRHR